MKVLYISSLISNHLFDDLINKKLTTGYTGQKYHGLFASGLSANLGEHQVTALSQPPISKGFKGKKEYENGVEFRYVPIIPVPIIKQLVYFFYTFFYTFYWCLKNLREEKVIFSSLMRIYNYPPIWLGACLFRCKSITIACDIPWMTTIQVRMSKLTPKQKIVIWMGRKMSSTFDGYVFLTETMNAVLNPKHKPYIVVEGFCDLNMSDVQNTLSEKYEKKVIIYAGGLNAKYGIANLIDAVKRLNMPDVELWLYGTGDMKKQLETESNPAIKFFGPKNNKEVVASELKACVLINPRPTTDEYTRYSFPSKTLEYMVSGTYTMTTRLAGIPSEYFDYCGVIHDYSAIGLCEALKQALSLTHEELHRKGLQAKAYVLENKNNVKQTKRVIDFAHGII